MNGAATRIGSRRMPNHVGDLSSWSSGTEAPLAFKAGDANLTRYVGNGPTLATDPEGLSPKSAVVGWVVRRVGGKLVKVSTIYTHKRAAALFLGKCAREGTDILVRKGHEAALKVAKAVLGRLDDAGKRAAGEILEGGNHAAGHAIRNLLGEGIGRGTRHIQFDGIGNRHIFYSLAGLMGLALASDGEAKEINDGCDKYSVDVEEVYSDPFPGESSLHYLTVSKYAGKDSLLSYVDWVNPCEWLAIGGDIGRTIDRETQKVLIGVIVTVSKNGQPIRTLTMDANGKLISSADWNDGELGEAVPFNDGQ